MTSMGSRAAIGPITFVEFGTAVDAEVCLGMAEASAYLLIRISNRCCRGLLQIYREE